MLVYLWSGAGYTLNPPIEVDTEDPQKALEEAVAKTLKKDKDRLIWLTGHNIIDEKDRKELEEDPSYTYLDLTEYDLGCGFVCVENAKMIQEGNEDNER